MLLRVDFSQPLFRALFPIIHDRIAEFAFTEGGTEAQVQYKLAQMLSGDTSINILVEFDTEQNSITAHGMYTIQPSPLGLQVVVDQLKVDSGHDESFVKSCIAYVESIPQVAQICMGTSEKKAKAFKKKYGFEIFKVLMIKNTRPTEAQGEVYE